MPCMMFSICFLILLTGMIGLHLWIPLEEGCFYSEKILDISEFGWA